MIAAYCRLCLAQVRTVDLPNGTYSFCETHGTKYVPVLVAYDPRGWPPTDSVSGILDTVAFGTADAEAVHPVARGGGPKGEPGRSVEPGPLTSGGR
jgi:hypothetical protein